MESLKTCRNCGCALPEVAHPNRKFCLTCAAQRSKDSSHRACRKWYRTARLGNPVPAVLGPSNCADCGGQLVGAHFNQKLCAACVKHRRRTVYKKARRRASRHSNQNLKRQTLSHYGKDGEAKCCWVDCEITDLDMLSLDHIENNGKEERKNGLTSGMGLYGYLRKRGWPTGYQTLCANHQIKKEIIRRRSIVKPSV